MNPAGKTAAEIAVELGITRQAVYKKLRTDGNLQNSLQGLTTMINGRTYYNHEAEIILKTAFVNRVDNASSQDGSQVVDSSLQESKPSSQDGSPVQVLHEVVAELRRQLDTLRSENAALREQLTVKDNQITAMQTTIDGLNMVIQQNARSLEATANALTAAQALHAADVKQLIETNTATPTQEAVTQEPHGLAARFRAWRDRKRG